MGWVLERLGADVGRALTDVNVLAYALDREGVIVWQNRASQDFIGDVRGSHFNDFVVVEDRRRAQEAFMSKVNGKAAFTDYVVQVRRPSGQEVLVEVSSVPLRRGDDVIGVLAISAKPPVPTPDAVRRLTPRQRDVLRLLAAGSTTDQIADELHIARETVRNHIRGVLSELRVHSRVEAIAAARSAGLLDD
jgi:PAS domain S-box-containing protein